ncbi:MAG: hypothetical protein L6R39_002671 [Caloplaca ligustica]|nr:MAG: hypothetical protein L6R39_002671 [Caloplaca ligustica]
MAGPVNLQADVGNLGLTGLNSVRGLLSTLSMDDVQPGAILQLQDIGTLFHASGPLASRVADELQRFSSYRMEKMALTIGWRRNDAASLLAQSAGGQAAALLALFLGNTHQHSKVGEVLFRFSNESLPKSKSIASVKQLAEVSSKVCDKLGSMGYGNFLAEQVTKLRLTYLTSNLPVPNCFLDALTEEATIGVLGAISRAQRETNLCARITGARGVGHIMALLLLLCADDVEVAVENVIIHGAGNRCIFLNVQAVISPDEHRYCQCPPTYVQLENDLKVMDSIQLPIDRTYSPPFALTFRWEGWLAARLEEVAQYGSLKRQVLAEDCCNVIWNIFQLEITSRARAALGSQPELRMREALVTMFDAHTWVPQKKDLKVCLEAISSKITSDLNCSNCFENMLPQLWRWITAEKVVLSGESDDYIRENVSFAETDWSGLCLKHRDLWQCMIEILIQGFAGLYIDPSPKATVVMNTVKFATASLGLYLELPWKYWFVDQNITVDRQDRLLGNRFSLGRGNGSSVLYPTLLHHLEMPPLFHIQYQLADGCFMLNGRYFENLQAGIPNECLYSSVELMENLDVIEPIYLGSRGPLDLTVSESVSVLILRLRINMDNRIQELNVRDICRNYENHLRFTTPCDHSPKTALETPLMHYVKIPSNPLAYMEPSFTGRISLYMTHQNRQMQFLCGRYISLQDRREPHFTMYMQDCCLNCAVQQALKLDYENKSVGIIVS